MSEDDFEGIHVCVYDLPEGLTSTQAEDTIARLEPSMVWVDAGGPLRHFLTCLQRRGIPAKAIPKGMGYRQ